MTFNETHNYSYESQFARDEATGVTYGPEADVSPVVAVWLIGGLVAMLGVPALAMGASWVWGAIRSGFISREAAKKRRKKGRRA